MLQAGVAEVGHFTTAHEAQGAMCVCACETFFGRANPDTLGRLFGFSLTCAKSSAGHGLGRKMTSNNKLEYRGRSLIMSGLQLILRGFS